MAKRPGAHRAEKRAKELKRIKKQAEKRLRRQGPGQPARENVTREGEGNSESAPDREADGSEDDAHLVCSAPS